VLYPRRVDEDHDGNARVLMTLRDVTEDDLPIFFEHQREPDGNRLAAWPARDHSAFMTHWRTKILGDSSVRKKTIVLGGNVAGNVVSWVRDGERLVGYWVGQSYWGRGAASAALAEFVTNCEKSRPLYAEVAMHNVASVRVLEKCGFRRMGDPVTGPDGVEEIRMRLGPPAAL
jgi:RimJ/RimL family protein N-acetyltransferase